MRSLMMVAGLALLGLGQVGVAAENAIVVAAVQVKHAQPAAVSAPVVVVRATPEKEVEAGSLEKFGAVGLPQ